MIGIPGSKSDSRNENRTDIIGSYYSSREPVSLTFTRDTAHRRKFKVAYKRSGKRYKNYTVAQVIDLFLLVKLSHRQHKIVFEIT